MRGGGGDGEAVGGGGEGSRKGEHDCGFEGAGEEGDRKRRRGGEGVEDREGERKRGGSVRRGAEGRGGSGVVGRVPQDRGGGEGKEEAEEEGKGERRWKRKGTGEAEAEAVLNTEVECGNAALVGDRLDCKGREKKKAVLNKEKEEEEEEEEEEEQEELVVVDLSNIVRQVPAGTTCSLEDLDTDFPVLVLGNGMRLIGQYEETFGTTLLLEEKGERKAAPHDHLAGVRLATVGSGGTLVEGQGGSGGGGRPAKAIRLAGMASTRITFHTIAQDRGDGLSGGPEFRPLPRGF